MNAQIAYTVVKLNSCFNIKEQTKFVPQHNSVYLGNCPEPNCNDNYHIETARIVSQQVFNHRGRDKFQLFKHANEQEHENVERQDLKIIGKGFRNCSLKCKVSDSLFCRELKPSLNLQEKSIKLKLFH